VTFGAHTCTGSPLQRGQRTDDEDTGIDLFSSRASLSGRSSVWQRERNRKARLLVTILLAGLFLPAWTPWLFALANCGSITIFWLYPQAFRFFAMSSRLPAILLGCYFLLLSMALIGSLYAWSTARGRAGRSRARA
jgi:hypothetical protein